MVFKKYYEKKIAAFLLVEVAIALMVAGVISAGLVSLYQRVQQGLMRHTTEARMDAISAALASYAMTNGTLPTAAQPLRTAYQPGQAIPQLYHGIVPFFTLGLPSREVRDGYGRWMSYTVAPLATKTCVEPLESMNKSPHALFCTCQSHQAPTAQRIRVQNIHGQSAVSPTDDDYIAFVIISHGLSGQGAVREDGTRTPSLVSFKVINYTDDFNFVDGVISPSYDDRMRWVTRHNLMAIYVHKPCMRVIDSVSEHGSRLPSSFTLRK